MARFPYPAYDDKFFAAVGKPTINVVKQLSYSAATVEHWGAIGNAQFTKLELSKKNRELVILLSSAKFNSTYEWTHHIPLSARVGVTDQQRDELRNAGMSKAYFSNDYDWEKAGFDETETTLLIFLEAVIDLGQVEDEALWQRATSTFSKREIVEIVSMQGFYYTFARLTTVLQIDFDGEQQQQARADKL